MDENRTPAPEEQSLNEVLQIRRDKLRELQAAGKDPFELVKYVRTANSAEIINNFEAMEGKEVSVAGRMMLRREMGKASFADLMDRDGKSRSMSKLTTSANRPMRISESGTSETSLASREPCSARAVGKFPFTPPS